VKPRFTVVGCGTAARHLHLPALRAADAEVTAFASRSRASAESARNIWGHGAVVDRWEEAVIRDDVDAVVVATPNSAHAQVAIAAAAAGKHVLVDKPLACTTAEADAMIAAALANGVTIVPFHNTRFAAPFVAARDVVASGRLGSVTGFRAAFGHGGPQVWAPEATWFFAHATSGGGCLIDLGVHIVDVVRFVVGDEIVSVAGLLNGTVGDVETDAHVLARTGRGAIGSIHASWSSNAGPDQQLTVVGTDGTLHLDTRTPLTLFSVAGERERIALPDAIASPYTELIAAMHGEHPPSVTAADGRAAVAVVEAAYRSAADGCTLVTVE
jgi:UDP-N-acetylglucosamine 3-dehydrogenase